LFDEKIGGTIHLALGAAYPAKEDGGGKNTSAIHWDFIKDTRKPGSKVIVNGVTMLKNGKIFG
jgi:aminopeptidase